MTQNELIERFFEVQQMPNGVKHDKMRGLKRSLTVYCSKHGNPDYARRCVKRGITIKGGDASLID